MENRLGDSLMDNHLEDKFGQDKSLQNSFMHSLKKDISPDLNDKIVTYLEMILDRLDTRLTTWLHNMERLSRYSVKSIEISIHLENVSKLLHSENMSQRKQVRLMQNCLERLLNPLWDLNQDIFSIFGDLDSLYAELNFFVNAGSSPMPDVELLNRINEKLSEMKYRTTYIRNGNIGISESIQAGRSIISIMKEHCYRLSTEVTKSEILSEFYEFKAQLSEISLQLISLTEQHLSRGKLWTSFALSEIESLKYRTQDELYDILEKQRADVL